jgi:DinB family protein
MKFLLMAQPDQQALYTALESMPEFIADTFGELSADEAVRSLPDDSFSPVEHCWHLADLEREGFAIRIRRLLAESNPWLENFDGGRLAEERQYKQTHIADGIAAFRQARLDNLALLQTTQSESWTRQGEQEGVGIVMLCDLPMMMAEHDAEHKKEIAEWLRAMKR